ncbi:MAG: S49 family peptidase [Phycisphaerales bacterium]|nr:S49 family peptidase [Phycisphaerales bacterium]
MITGPIRSEWTSACLSSHMGVWAVEPGYARAVSAAILAGAGVPRPTPRSDWGDGLSPAEQELQKVREMWSVDGQGLGVLILDGPMQKFDSKFGGVNTLRARKVVRSAMRDESVRGVLALIDSPGGTADGTLELADDLAALARAKPTATHVAGTMASAALWVGTQTRRVTAGPADLVGSIGTYAVVEDWSKAYAAEGVSVEVIAAGGLDEGGVKGQGVQGVPLSDAFRAEVKKVVEGLNELFLRGVANGRSMTLERVRALADGRVHLAAEAVKLGLIDAVETADQAAAALLSMIGAAGKKPEPARRRMSLARARLELGRPPRNGAGT